MVEGGYVVFRSHAAGLNTVLKCARRLGRVVRPGDLVLLEGPLGAGKTTFARALAEELGVTDPVRSPSFTIANIYSGRVVVQHIDLYRLDEVEEEDALALEEYIRADTVTLVEWPEVGEAVLGPAAWTVRMGHRSISTRSLELEAATAEARARWKEAV